MNGLFRYFWADCLGKKKAFMVEDLTRISGSALIDLASGFEDLNKAEQDKRMLELHDVLSEGVTFYRNNTDYMLARQASSCDFCWGGLVYIKKIYKAIKNSPQEDWEFVLWGLDIKQYYENIKWNVPKGMERYASDFMQIPFWESVYVSSGNFMITNVTPVFKTLTLASGDFSTMDAINYTRDLFLTSGAKISKTFEYTEVELTALALKNTSLKSIFDVSLKNDLEDSLHSLILNYNEVSAIIGYVHARMTSLLAMVRLHDVLAENGHDKALKIIDIHHDVLMEETSIPLPYEKLEEIEEEEKPQEKFYKTLEESWADGYVPTEVINDKEETYIWDKDTKVLTPIETPIKYYKGKLVPHQEKVLLDTTDTCKKLMLLKKRDPIAGSLIESILVYVSGLSCQEVDDNYEGIIANIERKAYVN